MKSTQFILILIFIIVFLMSLLPFKKAEAKDFGVQGHTLAIEEEDLLDLLLLKLHILQKNGGIKAAQEELQSKTLQRIKKPLPVQGIEKVRKPHTFEYDPTIVVPRDIKDHTGTLIHKAGTRINPLNHSPFNQIWLFIEGEDVLQVKWALEQQSREEFHSKIILVNGSPFDLSEHHGYRFYFDQLGKITTQLGIKRVPSRVSRNEDKLRIEEIPMQGETS